MQAAPEIAFGLKHCYLPLELVVQQLVQAEHAPFADDEYESDQHAYDNTRDTDGRQHVQQHGERADDSNQGCSQLRQLPLEKVDQLASELQARCTLGNGKVRLRCLRIGNIGVDSGIHTCVIQSPQSADTEHGHFQSGEHHNASKRSVDQVVDRDAKHERNHHCEQTFDGQQAHCRDDLGPISQPNAG